jgi:hypothetical protein
MGSSMLQPGKLQVTMWKCLFLNNKDHICLVSSETTIVLNELQLLKNLWLAEWNKEKWKWKVNARWLSDGLIMVALSMRLHLSLKGQLWLWGEVRRRVLQVVRTLSLTALPLLPLLSAVCKGFEGPKQCGINGCYSWMRCPTPGVIAFLIKNWALIQVQMINS